MAGPCMKQIAYIGSGMPYQVMKGLDRPLPREPRVYVVPIEGNWYIMYNNTD